MLQSKSSESKLSFPTQPLTLPLDTPSHTHTKKHKNFKLTGKPAELRLGLREAVHKLQEDLVQDRRYLLLVAARELGRQEESPLLAYGKHGHLNGVGQKKFFMARWSFINEFIAKH